MRNNNHQEKHRVSGYVSNASYLKWWDNQLERVRKLEGLPKGCGMGILLNRVAQFDIQLDLKSLRALTGADEPAVLTHKPKPVKRARASG